MIKKIKKRIIKFIYSRNNKLNPNFRIGFNVKLKKSSLGKFSGVAAHASVSNTKIDDFSSIGRYSKVVYTDIGKYCAISWDTTINAISHSYSNLTVNAFPYVPHVGGFVKERIQEYEKVVIENDVWVGANCVIMPGVKIGNGAIVGAGAVVTKNVPDYAIVVGSPAKIIKYRFSEDVIDKLLIAKWWDLPNDIIKENISLWQGELTDTKLERIVMLCD